MKSIVYVLAASFLATACAVDSTEEDTSVDESALKGVKKPICTGNEPPRKGAPFTFSSAGKVKLAAYDKEAAAFQSKFPTDSAEARYAAVLKKLSSKTCVADSDCVTGTEEFSATCLRYQWDGTNGTCTVAAALSAPPKPLLTCADVICPIVRGSAYQCEVENGTGAVGCVEPRACIEKASGGRGGR